MTNINARIAEKKGWRCEEMQEFGSLLVKEVWIFGESVGQEYPPQYTTDWRLAGENLEELIIAGFHLSYNVKRKVFMIGGVVDKDAKTAIGLKWLEWSER